MPIQTVDFELTGDHYVYFNNGNTTNTGNGVFKVDAGSSTDGATAYLVTMNDNNTGASKTLYAHQTTLNIAANATGDDTDIAHRITVAKSDAGATSYGLYVSGEDKNYFSGNVGIGKNTSPLSTSSLATLDVRANSGTLAVASISGQTSFAGLVVDNSGKGDLFAASSSGLNRFVITQAGNVGYWDNVPI